MNNIVEGGNELISVDDSDLLSKILRVLQHQNPFSISSDRLLIDIDSLASQVTCLQVDNPLGASEHLARSATVNFSPGFKQGFPTQIQEIRDCLKARLESLDQLNIEQYVSSLVTPLENFSGTANRLGFTYDFDRREQGLQQQKLSLERNSHSRNSLLKFHKLTIAVRNIGQFQQQLQKGLENHIDKVAQSESDREDLNEILEGMVEDDFSDFHQLMRVVDTETLGKLKKEAKITYLEYLLTNISTVSNAPDAPGVIYLRDLIRRLRLIEEYISDDKKADGDYLVNYAGISVNYKDLFSRSEVLDALPIIPIVVGNLGETTDKNRGERSFIFGLKLKLGGSVQAYGGRSSFDYHLNLLNPDSQEHQAELAKNQYFPQKVLKIAFLYYFVFASRSNPESADYNPNSELEYDPIRVFEASVLPVLRGSDEEAKKHLFRKIKEGFERFKVSSKIDKLRQLLRKLLERQTTLATRTYTRHIGVRKGILEDDINSILNKFTFFNDVLLKNTREALRYISVEQQSVDDTLCQLPADITIEDIRYFTAEERQQFSMEYDIKGIRALPVLWVPKNERCNRYFQQDKLVVFPYDNRRLDPNRLDSTQAFVYRFTWVLLAYICLNILLDAQKDLFIPMVRLHLGDHQNPSPTEEFIAALSKVLSHLLKEEHLSSSQGFRIQQEPTSFKIRNGLSSLYSVLPKKFRFTDVSAPKLDKLAIIVVSSRESDANRSNKNRANRIANLLGEVVSVRRLEDGAVQVETLRTFSENYQLSRLYKEPPVLIDQVENLYQQGYRHFLYIAQAPYSSTLHITQTDEDEGLFFMSPTLIKALKGRRDIKIYPVFFDKYYVRKLEKLKASSFYIQNTRELTSLVKDPSKQAVMFFNLFNGFTVGQGEDRFYNGVISYSTLLHIYTDILDDADIYRGLIDDTPLKNELLQYITLFHFSRYEARQKINLKLDPYQNIIGDESLGSLSLFKHMNGRAEFNYLAFLTQVRKVLNVSKAGRQ